MAQKEYLKMADVFKGVVFPRRFDDEAIDEMTKGDDCGNHFGIEDSRYWLATTEDHCKYAAHAINSHDELVAEVERLRESNKRMADAIWSRSSAFDCLIGRQEMTRELFIEQFLCDPLRQSDAE